MELKSITATVFLVAIGIMQMAGDLLGNPKLKGLGLATHVSPAPKVFTAHEGFETFSSAFFIHWQDNNNVRHSLEITPEVYQGVKGPYNRRNVYGAALSYSPLLSRNPNTKAMFGQVSEYAFCGDAPVLRELGIDPTQVIYPLQLSLVPRDVASKAPHWQLNYQVNCPVKEAQNG